MALVVKSIDAETNTVWLESDHSDSAPSAESVFCTQDSQFFAGDEWESFDDGRTWTKVRK